MLLKSFAMAGVLLAFVGLMIGSMVQANKYWTAYHAETQRMLDIGCKVTGFVGHYTIFTCPDGNLYKRQ